MLLTIFYLYSSFFFVIKKFNNKHYIILCDKMILKISCRQSIEQRILNTGRDFIEVR